jgi:hypothetical protein
MIYRDNLITITEDNIIFEHYYFPTDKKKVVRLSDIEQITVETPTIWNGKWRIHGTGSFKTWYPKDNKRPKRNKIFFASLKSQWIDIGFTVENAEQVEKILKEKKLIRVD